MRDRQSLKFVKKWSFFDKKCDIFATIEKKLCLIALKLGNQILF